MLAVVVAAQKTAGGGIAQEAAQNENWLPKNRGFQLPLRSASHLFYASWLLETNTYPNTRMENSGRPTFSMMLTKGGVSDLCPTFESFRPPRPWGRENTRTGVKPKPARQSHDRHLSFPQSTLPDSDSPVLKTSIPPIL
jgi:hypothetical protein